MASTASEKKRGAQPGNLNRLKHGFYSKQLRSLDGEEARRMEAELSEEIAAYRTLLKDYLENYLAAASEEKKGHIFELAGRAFTRIGNLVRIQRAVQGSHWDDSLEAIMARVLEDMDGIPADLLLQEDQDSDRDTP